MATAYKTNSTGSPSSNSSNDFNTISTYTVAAFDGKTAAKLNSFASLIGETGNFNVGFLDRSGGKATFSQSGTIKILGGNGITTTANGDTITISSTGAPSQGTVELYGDNGQSTFTDTLSIVGVPDGPIATQASKGQVSVYLKKKGVDTEYLADKAVTKDKLSDALQTQISRLNADGTLNFSNLAATNGVITTAMLANNFLLDGSKIAAGTVTADKLETNYKTSIDKAIAKTEKIITSISNGDTIKEFSGTTLLISGNDDISASIGGGGAVSIALTKAASITENDNHAATAAQVYKAITSAKTTVSSEAGSYIQVAETQGSGIASNSYKVSLDFDTLKTKLNDTFAEDSDLDSYLTKTDAAETYLTQTDAKSTYLTKAGLTAEGSNIVIDDTTDGKSVGLATTLTGLTSATFGKGATNTVIDQSGVAVGNVQLSAGGLEMDNHAITGLLAGSKNGDAINYDQFESVASQLGTVQEGKFTPKTYSKVLYTDSTVKKEETIEKQPVLFRAALLSDITIAPPTSATETGGTISTTVEDLVNAVNSGLNFTDGSHNTKVQLGGTVTFKSDKDTGSNITVDNENGTFKFGLKTTGSVTKDTPDADKLITSGAVAKALDGYVTNGALESYATKQFVNAKTITFTGNAKDSTAAIVDLDSKNSLNLSGDANISVASNPKGVNFTLNQELTGLTSAQFSSEVAAGEIKLGSISLKNNDGVLALSQTSQNTRINGVAKGIKDMDAVNVLQFKSVAGVLGTFDASSGTFTEQKYDGVKTQSTQAPANGQSLKTTVQNLVSAVNNGFNIQNSDGSNKYQVLSGGSITFKQDKTTGSNVDVDVNSNGEVLIGLKTDTVVTDQSNKLITSGAVFTAIDTAKGEVLDDVSQTYLSKADAESTYLKGVTAGDNIKVSEGDGKATVSLKKKLTSLTSAEFGNASDGTTINKGTITATGAITGGSFAVKNGPTLSATGLTMNSQTITNLGAGIAETDAANVGQVNEVYTSLGQVADELGTWNVSTKKFKAQSYAKVNKGTTVGSSTYDNLHSAVTDIIDAINGGMTFKVGSAEVNKYLGGTLAFDNTAPADSDGSNIALSADTSGIHFGLKQVATGTALNADAENKLTTSGAVKGFVDDYELSYSITGGDSGASASTALSQGFTFNNESPDQLTIGSSAAGVIDFGLQVANEVDNSDYLITSSAVNTALTDLDTKLTDAITAGDNYAKTAKITFQTDDGNKLRRGLDGTLAITGDDNIETAKTTDGKLQIKLKRDTNLSSATFKDEDQEDGTTTTVNKSGVVIVTGTRGATLTDSQLEFTGGAKGTVSLSKDGLNNGNNKITNVADGEDDTDAATVGQLSAVVTGLGGTFDNGDAIFDQFSTPVQGSGSEAAPLKAITAINHLIAAVNNRTVEKTEIANATAKDGKLATAYAVKEYVGDQLGATTLAYNADNGKDTKQTVTLSQGLDFKSSTNLTATVGASGEVTYALKDKLTDLTSAVFGDSSDGTTINKGTITATGAITGGSFVVKNGPTLSSAGLAMNSQKITGLAAGTATGEAVNYDQFSTVADQLGGLTSGSLTAQSYNKVNIEGQSTDSRTKIIDSVKDLITAVNTGFKVSDGNDDSATQITAGKTVTFKPADGEKNISVTNNAGTLSFELKETADKNAIANATVESKEDPLATALAVKGFVEDKIGATTIAYTANGVTNKKSVKLSDGLDFQNGNNLTASVDNDGKVKYDLNPTLTGITSIDGTALVLESNKVKSINDGKVTFDANYGYVATINGNAVVFGQDGKLTSLDTASGAVIFGDNAITLATKKVTGLAAGEVKDASTDAINGDQLFGSLESVKNILGDGFSNADGAVTYTGTGGIAGLGNDVTTISGAFTALKSSITSLESGFSGPVVYVDKNGEPTTDKNKITALSLVSGNGNPIQLKNVASALNLGDSTDATAAVQSLLEETDAKALNTAVNLKDLQAVAQAGLNFIGNDAAAKVVNIPLSNTLAIVGAGTINAENFAGVDAAAGNIRVIADSKNNKLIVELAKKLQALEEAQFGTANANTTITASGVTVHPESGSDVSLTASGLNNGGNKITNVGTPTKSDAGSVAANKEYVDTEITNAKTELTKTGFELKANGVVPADQDATVKLGDVVNVVNGANSSVSVVTTPSGETVDGKTTTHTLQVNVTGLPTAFVDKDGDALVKVNGSYYKAKDVIGKDGSINITDDVQAVEPAKVSLVGSDGNPTAMQLDNVKSVLTKGEGQTITNAINDAVAKNGNGQSAVNVNDLKEVNDRVQAGFNIKTSADGGIVDNTGIATTGDNINPDQNTLEFVAGANVTLKQEAGKITISTNNVDIVNNVIKSQGLPVSYGYKDAKDGTYKKAYKIGDKFYTDTAGTSEIPTGSEIVARMDYNDPMTLANVKSALGLTGNYNNTSTETNGGTPANPQAITVDDAQKAVAGESKDGKSGLLAKAGTDLNKGVNLGDLQAVAQAGLDFTANNQKDGQDVVIHRPAGTKIAIKGEGTVDQNPDNTYKTATNNIVVEAKADDASLTVKLAEDLRNLKSAIFEASDSDTGSLQVDGNGVRFLKDGTVDTRDENAPSIAKTGIDAGNQKVTNVKDGTIDDGSEDAVNGGQIAKILGKEPKNNYGENIGGTGKDNINDALKAVRSEVNNKGSDGKDDSNIGITKTEGNNGQDVYSVNMSKDLVLKTVTLDNGDGNGKAKLGVVHQAQYVGSETALDVNNVRITGVADAKDPTDAVNLKQMREMGYQLNSRVTALDNKVNKMNRELRAGISGAIAAANLPQSAVAGANMVSVAGGSYGGESAVALGFSKLSDSGKVAFKISGTSDSRGKVGVGAGVGFYWK
ncbi:YadA-like family protein [Gallibacterium melopsittaci]|uniref:YadA-like family protein n=1 Tax=Gallibacterium melopsittaci TaxID=516063 RepID=A0ABV6HWR5_9PAST